MPLASAALRTALVAQPTRTENPVKISVELVFRGVSFVPSDLYDALNAQWGTITSPKDGQKRGTYIFEVAP